MKYTLLLLCTLLIRIAPSNAQNSFTHPLRNAALGALPTAKVTATPERVIASAGFRPGSINDSIVYNWSGSRASYLVPGPELAVTLEDYDGATDWINSSGTYQCQARTLQTFDAAGNRIGSVDQSWDPGTLSWRNVEQTHFSYVGALMTESLKQQWNSTTGVWVDNIKTRNTYSGTRLLQSNTEMWDAAASAWDSTSEISYYYTGGDLAMQVELAWDLGSAGWKYFRKTTFENYVGGIAATRTFYNWSAAIADWEGDVRYAVTYGGGLVISDSIYNWQSSGHRWQLAVADQLYYSGSDLTELQEQVLNTSSGSFEPFLQAFYHYTGTLLDTVNYQGWDPTVADWGYTARRVYEYNSNNSLTYVRTEVSDGGVWRPPYIARHYYYEPYGTTTHTASAAMSYGSVRLYPNPAVAAQVYLDYRTADAAPATVQLTDMVGRVYYRAAENGSIGDHSIAIPVASLASGVYIVQLISKGVLIHAAKLVK